MSNFSQISLDAFDEIQTDAGVLLNSFDPEDPAIAEGAIICATTGGINPICIPTYEDFGEDVDNCPNNMMELKRLTGWECTLGFTALTASASVIKMALGAADVTGTNVSKIVPRAELEDTDFADVWWVGDRVDGGMVAIRLINALSTSGFSLQTSKNGKGQIAVTLTGHVSITAQDTVPMEFYVAAGATE